MPKTTMRTRIAAIRGASNCPAVNWARPPRTPYTAAPARRPTRNARATFTSFVNRILPIPAPTIARMSRARSPPRAAPKRYPTTAPSRAPIMDITVAHRPWPQNARARPVRMRTPARRSRISGEVMIPGSAAIACRFGSHYKKTARALSGLVTGRALSAAEHIVRTLGDFPDIAFVDNASAEDVFSYVQVVVAEDVDHRRDADRVADHRDGPQGELRDDVLPHLLVRDAGEGRLDVGRLLEGHHEAVRELTAHLVGDAGRSLVDEGEDEIELPCLAGEAAERVCVRCDLGAQALVSLLEEQHEPRVFLVPLRVQLEQPAREDVRDEQVDHLVRPVIAEVEDNALPVADRPEDVGKRILGLRHGLQERESIEPADPPLQALEGHLVGPLRSEHLHRRVLHGGDEVPASASLRDLV